MCCAFFPAIGLSLNLTIKCAFSDKRECPRIEVEIILDSIFLDNHAEVLNCGPLY